MQRPPPFFVFDRHPEHRVHLSIRNWPGNLIRAAEWIVRPTYMFEATAERLVGGRSLMDKEDPHPPLRLSLGQVQRTWRETEKYWREYLSMLGVFDTSALETPSKRMACAVAIAPSGAYVCLDLDDYAWWRRRFLWNNMYLCWDARNHRAFIAFYDDGVRVGLAGCVPNRPPHSWSGEVNGIFECALARILNPRGQKN
jgi:hypothetical protein